MQHLSYSAETSLAAVYATGMPAAAATRHAERRTHRGISSDVGPHRALSHWTTVQ